MKKTKSPEIVYRLLKLSENEIYLLSNEKCQDGDFYYDTRWDSIHPWIDAVEVHGVKGLGWEGSVIWKIVSSTVNYSYGITGSGKRFESSWNRMEIVTSERIKAVI